MEGDRVHVLVLNHNGRALLEACLPSVVACVGQAAIPCRMTVVDNASTDDSVRFLRENWPELGVFELDNRGMVSFNEAVGRIDEPVVLLLNNDVRLAAGCVDRLAALFAQHRDCFLAGPLCWGFDGHYEGTRSALCFRRGLVHTRLAPANLPVGRTGYTSSAGAVLAVSREKFLALGGFDPLFLPGRYEDLDFAFRGWMAGWKAYYVPDAVAYHCGSASFRPRLGSDGIAELDARNALLFAWKNLHDPIHLGVHLLYLPLRTLRAIAIGQLPFLRGLARAIARLPSALRRRGQSGPRRISERELFGLLGAGG